MEAEVNVIRGPDHAGELGGQSLVFRILSPLGDGTVTISDLLSLMTVYLHLMRMNW